DESIQVRAKVNQEFPQIYPQPGWVEHDPEEIWRSVTIAIERALALAGVESSQIAAIGITNQRETSLIWERKSGKAIHNALVWQDRRTTDSCSKMKADGLEALYRERTGLVLDPYFSGTKIAWILDHVQGARGRIHELAFGTIETYLIWRLSGGKAHVTDVSNASRTLLFNLAKLDWDDQLLQPLNIPRELLPQVRGSSDVYGETHGVPGLPNGIPIAGAAGDQQAALFGQACFAEGDAKCTYGTGAFLLVNIGNKPIASKSGLLTTVGWKLGDAPAVYALEGSAFIAGAAVQWLRDGLGLIASAGEIEALAASVPDSGGVVFVPALVGLGAPHWRPEARGLLNGITRGTTRAHLARAALEGIVLQIHDLAGAMEKDFGKGLSSFKVDGGATANNLLMQMQADLLDLPLTRPQVTETTALGAAFLAGLATGIWNTPEAITTAWKADRTFEPQGDEVSRGVMLEAWRRAVAIA
ncbi:MAG: glycerol kinase GlpK, partial [Deltaproteobacteria bacterium]|nr:glycerol kinase GlpK [Deltaproteobacteria bacterium]